MKPRHYTPKPAQSYCQLCKRLFCYFQMSKRRIYCGPCVEIERQTANDFFNGKAREERLAARENARLIHIAWRPA